MSREENCVTHSYARFERLEKELELNKSWVKHHQRSVELKFEENNKLVDALREIKSVLDKKTYNNSDLLIDKILKSVDIK